MSPRPPLYTHRVTLKSGAEFLAVVLAESPVEVWARGVWVENPERYATHKWGRETVASVEPLTLFPGGSS